MIGCYADGPAMNVDAEPAAGDSREPAGRPGRARVSGTKRGSRGRQDGQLPAADGDAAADRVTAWSPFRHRLFAAMWTAQFVSNIGGWMQTVAAQWLMLTLTSSAVYVALVQTAAGLPVVLFAVLAGTIGDLVDRRRFLLLTQTFMLIAAAALGALAIAGLVRPWVLLALLFAVGTGQALTSPTWQTLQPELVSPTERPQAISLGAVNQNLARAIGPAIGGALLVAASAGTVFLLNAVTFAAVLAVIFAWHSSRPADALPREHVGEAVRAGGRYVAASPVLRVILVRAGLFIFFASAVWALLPLTARSALHLGSGGYGLLLGSVGIGAVAGAALLPRLRARLSPDAMLASGSIGLAAVTLVLAYARLSAVAAVALVAGGACWVLALSTLNSLYQLSLPQWVKARGMSFYLMVFQGGNAIGSAVMGLAAEHAGLSLTLAIAAAGLALTPLAALVRRFQPIPPQDLLPAGEWPAPHITPGQAPRGPVLVSIEYRGRPGLEDELMTALRNVRFSRRRTGATSWRAWRDAADATRMIEQFVVASWDEHVRQHEHVTKRDQDRLDRVRDMTDPAHQVTVTHWLTVTPPRPAPPPLQDPR
jgi:MFS family permease